MPGHVSDPQKRAAALQAARRIVSRGERPRYGLLPPQDGSWTVDGSLGVTVAAETRKAALTAARAAIAAVLEVDLDSFDLQG